jgi:hypothetical protein
MMRAEFAVNPPAMQADPLGRVVAAEKPSVIERSMIP